LVTADFVRAFADRFTVDGYSAFRRLHTNWNVLGYKFDSSHGKPGVATDADLKPFWTAVADHCRSDNRAAAEEVIEIVRLGLTADFLGPDVNARYKRLDARLTAAGASEWMRKTVDGINLIAWAWEARGTGLGDAVTEEGGQRFRDRLLAAEDRFTAAHRLAPDRPEAAAGMITVCMGLGRDRDEMEEWFVRAVTADPVAWPAFGAKLEYLKPKWHGTPEEMLAFARQALRVATPDDQRNELVYGAYFGGGLNHGRAEAEVAALPGVWADLRAAYEPYLAARPGDRPTRTRFFRVCVLCGQWAAADAHRRILGDGWGRGVFNPDEWSAFNRLVDLNLPGKAKP
jgi:hypothetical protein